MIYTFLLCGLEMPTFCMEKFFIKKGTGQTVYQLNNYLWWLYSAILCLRPLKVEGEDTII